MQLLEIDGSKYSGSGTIVRQAVAFAALTGQAIRVYNVRVKRPNPGLRPQHVRVVEAIGELVQARTEGVRVGSLEFAFWPGELQAGQRYRWNIGSAGSTTLLALAVLPILAWAGHPVELEIIGGLFQDFAPSAFHLEFVVLPLLRHMGIHARVQMKRPGYVPRGGGILQIFVDEPSEKLRPVVLAERGQPTRLWGIALASHLQERRVAERIADSAAKVLKKAGYECLIETRYDRSAIQPGAAFALFCDLSTGSRLGADMAGAPKRPSEEIGKQVAQMLLEDLASGATVDRHAADELVPFAALAQGTSKYLIPQLTDHIESNLWLSELFFGIRWELNRQELTIHGAGFQPRWAAVSP